MSLPASVPPEPPMSADPTTAAAEPPRLSWKLIGRAILGLFVLIAVGGLLGWLLREPIAWAGTWFIDVFGLGGLGLLTLAVDASPLPLTNEPLMVLAIGAGVHLWLIFAVMASGSTLAGLVGWIGGRMIGQHTAPGRWIMKRYPGVQLFLVRWGALGVFIAALRNTERVVDETRRLSGCLRACRPRVWSHGFNRWRGRAASSSGWVSARDERDRGRDVLDAARRAPGGHGDRVRHDGDPA